MLVSYPLAFWDRAYLQESKTNEVSLNNQHGGVSERPKEAVLKTAVMQVTVGSNPTPSATKMALPHLSFPPPSQRAVREGRSPSPKLLPPLILKTVLDGSSPKEEGTRGVRSLGLFPCLPVY